MEEYLEKGPGFVFLFHPALGPLWDVIAQKIRGGALAPGSELVLEVSREPSVFPVTTTRPAGNLGPCAHIVGRRGGDRRSATGRQPPGGGGLCPWAAWSYYQRLTQRPLLSGEDRNHVSTYRLSSGPYTDEWESAHSATLC